MRAAAIKATGKGGGVSVIVARPGCLCVRWWIFLLLLVLFLLTLWWFGGSVLGGLV